MEPAFWHERWENNQIGFHQENINTWLQQYWHALDPASGSRILVPLCGKSRDLLWLRQQGHAVAGIELSPLAIDAFFSENKLVPALRQEATYSCHSHDGIDLYCGDFFDLQAADLGTVHGCFDRAALVAMTPDQRPLYAKHLAELLQKNASMLLVTMVYDATEMDGPPFAVPRDEVVQLFSQDFSVEQLAAVDVISRFPAFRDRGLSSLHEHVYQLVRN